MSKSRLCDIETLGALLGRTHPTTSGMPQRPPSILEYWVAFAILGYPLWLSPTEIAILR